MTLQANRATGIGNTLSGSSFSTQRDGRRRRSPRHTVPAWVGWLALAAFGLRALVPLGFEPGADGLSIVLCHEGFPAGYFAHGAAHRQERGAGARTDRHCLFCNSTSPAPAYALTSMVYRAPYAVGLTAAQPLAPASIRFAHVPQARAPPALI